MQRRALAAAAAGVVMAVATTACSAGQNPAPGDAAPAAEPSPDASPAPSPTAEPVTEPDDRLLPNLQSMPAEDMMIENDNGTDRLRFTSIIANTGVGPVETLPDDEGDCPPDQRHASQVIYHDVDGDGRYDPDVDDETSTRPAGCMLDHPDHDHWHFDAAAKYVLTEPGSAEPISSADKVSFCWRDNREVPAETVPRPEEHYGDCDRDTVQGITPGWADVYPEDLPDQHLDLPADLPDGAYCLWNEADPQGLLVETSDADNWAVTAIEITGTEVAEVARSTCDPASRP